MPTRTNERDVEIKGAAKTNNVEAYVKGYLAGAADMEQAHDAEPDGLGDVATNPPISGCIPDKAAPSVAQADPKPVHVWDLKPGHFTYFQGVGDRKDRYLKRAAQGDPCAMMRLAEMYYLNGDYPRSREMLRAYSDADPYFDSVQGAIVESLDSRLAPFCASEKAAYQRAADAGWAEPMLHIAVDCYENGNRAEAYEWFERFLNAEGDKTPEQIAMANELMDRIKEEGRVAATRATVRPCECSNTEPHTGDICPLSG